MPKTTEPIPATPHHEAAKTPERRELSSGEAFIERFRLYEETIEHNPYVDKEETKKTPVYTVYSKVFDRVHSFQGADEGIPMYNYEEDVLDYMSADIRLKTYQLLVDPEIVRDNDKMHDAVAEIVDRLVDARDEGAVADIDGLDKRITMLTGTLDRLEGDTPLSDGKELAEYINMAEHAHVMTNQKIFSADQSPWMLAREAKWRGVESAIEAMQQDALAYKMVAVNHPSGLVKVK